mmetsp:Transcript_4862/g.13562  ORF Transcript_4862/g.13562 Transcript_4862/m.13562 type:complete len:602 (+) Transcript_4862:231-2036(+)|eukprot:CAMPEP_0117660094 /NCGR_PEP_ID=MMETSP0804-20121206/6783_1 /TAXON_ID=1074897 /ORGANISM="Tetraselmis astigmatica, Strain CCMP880" /LENGTH=601 /DNA_ID=CAMNT_0005466797 /DNA_START=356 /DNA_END=2161 /DNA_ORIENTATION=-
MTFTNAQLFKHAEETAKRAHKKQLVSEKDFAAVWLTIENWIKSQFDITKGAHVLNFVKLGWVAEPVANGQLRPMFVLLDSYARAHALQCGPGATLASSINRGWHMESVEDMNFSKLAIRFSQGLGKDTIFMCVRVLLQVLGSVLSSGQAVELKLGVGTMKARGRKISFDFDAQFSRGRAKNRSSTAEVPASAALPGGWSGLARIGSNRSASRAESFASHPSRTERAYTTDITAVVNKALPTTRQQEVQARRQFLAEPVQGSNQPLSASPGLSTVPSITSSASSRGNQELAGPRRPTATGTVRKVKAVQEDMTCLLMHGVRAVPTSLIGTPVSNPRPYGTDMDSPDLEVNQQQRGEKPTGRRHFGPGTAKDILQQYPQVNDAPSKGKRMNRFIQGEGAYNGALQRHLNTMQQQKLQDDNIMKAMEIKKKQLDKQAQRTMQHRNMEQQLLAEELRVQIATQKLAKAEERSVASVVPLIQHEDPNPAALYSQADHYRQELDGQVMEKAFTKHQERVMEACQDLAMITDAQEDLMLDVRSERDRVRAAQAQMRADWEQQIAETRQAQEQRQAANRQRPMQRPPSAIQASTKAGLEAVKASLLSPW